VEIGMTLVPHEKLLVFAMARALSRNERPELPDRVRDGSVFLNAWFRSDMMVTVKELCRELGMPISYVPFYEFIEPGCYRLDVSGSITWEGCRAEEVEKARKELVHHGRPD
jgi:hypothetical protein